MTRKELIEKYNLYGAIMEPAPYYWERVYAAINEAFMEGQIQAAPMAEQAKLRETLKELMTDDIPTP